MDQGMGLAKICEILLKSYGENNIIFNELQNERKILVGDFSYKYHAVTGADVDFLLFP